MKKLLHKIYQRKVYKSYPVIGAYDDKIYYPVEHIIFGIVVGITYDTVSNLKSEI
jgi:hypothetical protein